MTQKDPSYLLNRNGIYYFHYRIPKHLKHHYGAKDFIRKSLKTTNRYKALNKARLIWSEVMSKSTQDEIDADAQRQANLYSRGKELYQILTFKMDRF